MHSPGKSPIMHDVPGSHAEQPKRLSQPVTLADGAEVVGSGFWTTVTVAGVTVTTDVMTDVFVLKVTTVGSG